MTVGRSTMWASRYHWPDRRCCRQGAPLRIIQRTTKGFRVWTANELGRAIRKSFVISGSNKMVEQGQVIVGEPGSGLLAEEWMAVTEGKVQPIDGDHGSQR